MVPLDKLAQITERFEFLEAQLNAGAAPGDIAIICRSNQKGIATAQFLQEPMVKGKEMLVLMEITMNNLLAGLANTSRVDGRGLALSMEQFSRADQPVLDAYLAGLKTSPVM